MTYWTTFFMTLLDNDLPPIQYIAPAERHSPYQASTQIKHPWLVFDGFPVEKEIL